MSRLRRTSARLATISTARIVFNCLNISLLLPCSRKRDNLALEHKIACARLPPPKLSNLGAMALCKFVRQLKFLRSKPSSAYLNDKSRLPKSFRASCGAASAEQDIGFNVRLKKVKFAEKYRTLQIQNLKAHFYARRRGYLAAAREALMVKNKVCRYFFSQKVFEETDNASMGIVRKVWEQGHVIRKKKYFGKMQAIWLIRI